jgi:uncharacterized membrane protein
MKEKTHAKDYLLEHIIEKDIPNWLAMLIQKSIDTSGKIIEEDKTLVYEKLLKENSLPTTCAASHGEAKPRASRPR